MFSHQISQAGENFFLLFAATISQAAEKWAFRAPPTKPSSSTPTTAELRSRKSISPAHTLWRVDSSGCGISWCSCEKKEALEDFGVAPIRGTLDLRVIWAFCRTSRVNPEATRRSCLVQFANFLLWCARLLSSLFTHKQFMLWGPLQDAFQQSVSP